MTTVAVIGGGAAGFFGAIAAAQANPQLSVTLLEAARQPLGKVRISGGGRCNVTHACFEPALLVPHYPRGGKALRGAFTRFQPRDTIAWFARHGVTLKTEADGRMFPVTDDSATIVDCLQGAVRQAGVQVRTGVAVQTVTRTNAQFQLTLQSGTQQTSDRVLLATGSSPRGHAIAQSLGHTIVPPVPSLFTFNLRDPRLAGLAGLAVRDVAVRLVVPGQPKLEQRGPLLITHWGISGPAVLKLSAWGARLLHDRHYQATLRINWVPHYNGETLRAALLALKEQFPRRTIAAHTTLPLPRRLWQQLIQQVGLTPGDRWAEVSHKTLQKLAQELTNGEFQITGKGVFKEEFVTCGGVQLAEVDFKTMASRVCPGLYLAGEVLDLDGVTGGFNFQSAWTTGWLAGQAIAAPSPT